jgi:hypothetical protein
MPTWVDVRIDAAQERTARAALMEAYALLKYRVERDPPRDGIGGLVPEIEIQLFRPDGGEQRVRGELESCGVSVLAIRERVGGPWSWL